MGDVIWCSERGELSYPPASVGVDGGPQRRVLASAGPWIMHTSLPGRGGRALARIQVMMEGDDGDDALLLRAAVGADPQWTIEGDYD
ncbi:hypothetical protein ACIA5G_33585 [Amycolatopsis sp. NPDC051758]|uniref:hypothetical protein n=1 Tax=Amycolatopsis sp. NPDC051758 TaxID=3363935 RepID=UPI0037A55B98